MRSTFSGFNTVIRGLYAQQMSLDTVGHNVSNINTKGYSRQRVNLVTTSSESIYGANGKTQIGTGVAVESITRIRDTFMDQQMWKESSTLGQGKILDDTLGKIDGIFQEPTGTGFQDVLNKFWSAWQTVSTNASDNGGRMALRERAVEVVNAVQHNSQQLKDMATDINSVLQIKVGRINQITSEISGINRQVAIIETGGQDHANDLRDRRDALVDELSQMINVRVSEDKYGNYTVQSSGQVLVDGSSSTELELSEPTTNRFGYEEYSVRTKELKSVEMTFTNGELKGLLDARDSNEFGIKGYLEKLDTVSKFFLTDFNEVHRQGYGLDGQTGRNFFGESGVHYTAWNPTNAVPGTGTYISQLKVNPLIMADTTTGPGMIAAKSLAHINPSNASGGLAQVSGNYTGGPEQKYEVKITGVDGNGRINQIECTVNGTTTTFNADASSTVFEFSLPDGVKLKIDSTTANKVNDTYTFTPKQEDAAGDNAVRMCEALKADIHKVLGSDYNAPNGSVLKNMSLDSYWNSVIGALGVQKQNAARLSDNQTTLVKQITNWRESVAGVNMDEEMENMIRFQKGYSAAARMVTTIDEMLDKLINGTGVVGR